MRRLLAALLCCALALVPAMAQAYPERPIRLVIGFGAGGASDIVARRVAQKVSALPGLLENRAGGNLAFEVAAHAGPDGTTIAFGSPAFITPEAARWQRVVAETGPRVE